jgi:hypothetical protein
LDVGLVFPVASTVPSKKAIPEIGLVPQSRRDPSDWKIIPGQVIVMLFVFGGIRILAVTEIMLVVVLVLK